MLRDFTAKEVVPVYPEWEREGHPPREFYHRLGELGVFGIEVPEEYGYITEFPIARLYADTRVSRMVSSHHVTSVRVGSISSYAFVSTIRRIA